MPAAHAPQAAIPPEARLSRHKTIRRIGALGAGQAHRRLDAAHRAAAHIVKHHSNVAIEDSKLFNMTASAKGTVDEPGTNVAQKAGLNRVMLDLAHGQFRTILERKALAIGGTIILVDPRNTSRRCNPCGRVSKNSRKSQAEFKCVSCSFEANADYNASSNTRDLAFGQVVDRHHSKSTGERPGLACESSVVGRRKQEKSFPQTAVAA